MKCLILAGGAGNRMWPISRKNYPKQFVFLDGKHSMFQESIIRNMPFCDEFIITTSKKYQNIVTGQLAAFPGLKYRCIFEEQPIRIPAALLFTCFCIDSQDELLVVSTDSIIDYGDYAKVIVDARERISEKKIVCVGAHTKHPSLGVGYLLKVDNGLKYILPKNEDELLSLEHNENSFVDTGILLGKAITFRQEFEKCCPKLFKSCSLLVREMDATLSLKEILIPESSAANIPKLSLGYEFISKTDSIELIIGNLFCSRLISLLSLEYINEFSNDYMNVFENCEEVTIANLAPGKVVAANGLKDLMVINTEDAVYISKKNQVDNIKKILDEQSSNEHLKNVIEECTLYYTTWGIKETLYADSTYWIKRITLYPGKELTRHFHEQRVENWTIVDGHASVFLDGNVIDFHKGDSIHIEVGKVHQISNKGSENIVVIETAYGRLNTEHVDSDIANIVCPDLSEDLIALHPFCKETIWGGKKLHDIYGKKACGSNIAESWEISAHPNGQSIVQNGKFKGATFGDYLEKIGKEALGWKGSHYDRFPLLVKFIDARDNLSVQVHPDNDYCLKYEQQYGKNEMWYVMDTEPGAYLYCGFNRIVNRAEIEERIKNNSLFEILNKIEAHPGETYFIPAGTIHAIGSGVLLCEVQQNSDVTYRLYDYGRLDKDGRSRELHVQKGLDVLRLDVQAQNKPEITADGCEVLCNCKYFTVTKYTSEGSSTIWGDQNSFTLIIVIQGKGTITVSGSKHDFFAGSSYFVPAKLCAICIEGNAVFLSVRL